MRQLPRTGPPIVGAARHQQPPPGGPLTWRLLTRERAQPGAQRGAGPPMLIARLPMRGAPTVDQTLPPPCSGSAVRSEASSRQRSARRRGCPEDCSSSPCRPGLHHPLRRGLGAQLVVGQLHGPIPQRHEKRVGEPVGTGGAEHLLDRLHPGAGDVPVEPGHSVLAPNRRVLSRLGMRARRRPRARSKSVPVPVVSRIRGPHRRYSPLLVGDGTPKQKEWYSRAWVVAAAAAANYTYRIVTDDEHGVDMTVHCGIHTIDFQLKATSHPEWQDGCLIHDLDVRTYDLLRAPTRSAYGVLALVVVGDDTTAWLDMDETGTRIAHSAYYLPMIGMPDTDNVSTVRLKVPTTNLLTVRALETLMGAQAARWVS